MEHLLHDPDTSDLVPAADSGLQTEPAAEPAVLTMRDLPQLGDIQQFLNERDAWLKSRVATHEERCPF